MCVVRAGLALGPAHVCMQGMTRPHVKMTCNEKNGTFHVIAPMHLYVTSVLVYNLHTTIFSRAYSFITRMLPVCTRTLLVCTRMLLVCSRVYSYVTRMYSYVTRMLLVCCLCVVLVTVRALVEKV